MRAEAREANRQTDLAHPVREATLTSHTDAVTAVALSADGHTALTGSSDQTAIMWNLADPAHPRREATLTGHTDAVTAVALSADGHTALTGSWDHTAIVWNLSVLDQLLNPSGAVCMAAGGGLDPTTWNRYIPATIATFRETC
jgi:WD40 repeat protein